MLLVSVNSKERAERARALFGNVLAARIGPPLTEIQSFEQLDGRAIRSIKNSAQLAGDFPGATPQYHSPKHG